MWLSRWVVATTAAEDEHRSRQRRWTVCLMPHIRSRLLGRAWRQYGADQHHQPRHTACATLLLLLRVPSAVASVCCVLSVRCGGCSLGPLSVDRLCDCDRVPASLSESVSARNTKECACMHVHNCLSRRFIRATTIGAPCRHLSPPPPLRTVLELLTT